MHSRLAASHTIRSCRHIITSRSCAKSALLPLTCPIFPCKPSSLSSYLQSTLFQCILPHILNLNIPSASRSSVLNHPRKRPCSFSFILANRQSTLMFSDNERGILNHEYFPTYIILVVEHTPWVQVPISIPKASPRFWNRISAPAGMSSLVLCIYRSLVFPV